MSLCKKEIVPMIRYFLFGFMLLLMPMVGLAGSHSAQFQTSVAPKSNEDLAAPCDYDLIIPDTTHKIQAVWVIFYRNRDTLRLYSDPQVRDLSAKRDMALMLAYHCKSTQSDEMNMDPKQGLGRALFTALDQFAASTGHKELSSSKLVYFGFAGTGSLAARLVAFAPDRALAAIPFDPGHFDPLGMDTIELEGKALNVPQLVIANGKDSLCGTTKPYLYFAKYREKGAPWAFVVQNNLPQCCILKTTHLIVLWLDAVMGDRLRPAATARTTQNSGLLLFIKREETDTKDGWNAKTSNITEARSAPSQSAKIAKDELPAGWLQDQAVADEWLHIVTNKNLPVSASK
jgi:hypothetical protein